MAAEHVALIGARIKQAREEARLTQRELADRIPGKADSGQVSKWERGEHRPGDDTLEHIAKVLKKPIAWFMVREANGHETPDLTETLGRGHSQLDEIQGTISRLVAEVEALKLQLSAHDLAMTQQSVEVLERLAPAQGQRRRAAAS